MSATVMSTASTSPIVQLNRIAILKRLISNFPPQHLPLGRLQHLRFLAFGPISPQYTDLHCRTSPLAPLPVIRWDH